MREHRLTTSQAKLYLFILWLIVQGGVWYVYGIGTSLEAEKYTHAADYLLQHGSFPEKKYLFYALTPLLIALNLKIGLGYTGAVIMQLLFNLLSTWLFFKLVVKTTNSTLTGLITTAILILFLPYQTWNVHLYTESVFLSCVILLLYSVHKLSMQKNLRWQDILLLLLAIVLVVTARPFGILFIPAVLVFVIAALPKRFLIASIAVCLAGCVVFYYFLNRAFSGSVDWNALVSNINGHIICDIPDQRFITTLDLKTSDNPVDQLVYYIFHNPAHYLKLSCYRLGAFFNITRSYYSKMHNLTMGIYMLVIYGFLLMGMKRFCRSVPKPFVLFVLSSIILYTFAITLQCDDYHSRFIMALVPHFLLIGAFGVNRLVRNKDLSTTKQTTA